MAIGERFCPECGVDISCCEGCGGEGHGESPSDDCTCGHSWYGHSVCFNFCMEIGCDCTLFVEAFPCSIELARKAKGVSG